MNLKIAVRHLLLTVFGVFCTATTLVSAQDATLQSLESMFDLSLEQLMDIEVTSVSRKAQRLSEATAAVFVISQNDIRRSGATSIPEILRMAPGVQVARIDGNKWAVSIRGFNGRFANKLLVLMDGRSIYTPLFSGVFWDVQDTVLEDIDRIEVIRGPGAALWGANAVNGVINILTKSAADTQGTLLSAGTGNQERGFATIRHGGKLGDKTHYRAYAKYFNRDGSIDAESNENTADNWDVARAGFRLDWEADPRDFVTLQGDLYAGNIGETLRSPSPASPRLQSKDTEQDVAGGNILLRWSREFSPTSNLILQSYYDRTKRSGKILKEVRDTFDIDFQHRFPFWTRHDLLWGLGYRYTIDDTTSTSTVLFDPGSRDNHLFSGFLQDDISLIENHLYLTLGSKFSHNDYTGFEIQPNARLRWMPDARQTVWASIARAVRTPSRGEEDGRVSIPLGTIDLPSKTVPLTTHIIGSRDLASEILLAYELGYRIQATDRLGIDISAFYNDYDNLLGNSPGAPSCEPGGFVVSNPLTCLSQPGTSGISFPVFFNNDVQGETYGVELFADWHAANIWRLQGAYSYLNACLRSENPAVSVRDSFSPQHQFTLRSSLDFHPHWTTDLWFRYTDRIPALDISSYFSLDARLAWKPVPDVELSIIGQNLLDDHHAEFYSELNDVIPTEIERSLYFQLRWYF